MQADNPAAPPQIIIKTPGSLSSAILKLALILVVLFVAFFGYRIWNGFTIADTPPVVRSVGPTIVQLERLQYLVSTRVHVADILVGESRWLKGSWIVIGDALIGVDMPKAEIRGKDEDRRTAVIVLPSPIVMSSRVNHERTQKWDIKSNIWIPGASSLLGDNEAMQQQAMSEAQRLVERAASSSEFKDTARRDIEGALREFYGQVDWQVNVQWK